MLSIICIYEEILTAVEYGSQLYNIMWKYRKKMQNWIIINSVLTSCSIGSNLYYLWWFLFQKFSEPKSSNVKTITKYILSHHSFLNAGNLTADVNRDMVTFFVGFAILHFFHAITIFLHHCKFGIIQKQPPL